MNAATKPLPKLTPTQAVLLRAAARTNTLTGLRQCGWIESAADGHMITDIGYATVGRQRPVPPDAVQNLVTIGDLQLLEGIPVRPKPRASIEFPSPSVFVTS